MSHDDWLKNVMVVMQLGRALCFSIDPQLSPEHEFIKNTQLALPLCDDQSVPINVKVHTTPFGYGVFALRLLPKHAFLTAFPGDVVRCNTPKPFEHTSTRFRACTDITTTRSLQLNHILMLLSSNQLIESPQYLAHVIRQASEPQQTNCVARLVQSGLQVLFFATRDIEEKEELLCDWEHSSMVQSLCVVCLDREAKVKTCSRCKFATYCSRQCQTQHWPQHKHMCFENWKKNHVCSFAYLVKNREGSHW